MLKRKYADYSSMKDIVDSRFWKIDMNGDEEYGAVCVLKIFKTLNKIRVQRRDEERVILDDEYKWLTLYPREGNFAIVAIFNPKLELVEFYFDIAKKVNYKPQVPYIDDLYLDVVMTPENEVIFLDEDELMQALRNGEIGQSDYELAKKTADKIVNKFHKPEKFEELKEKSIEYLRKILSFEEEANNTKTITE